MVLVIDNYDSFTYNLVQYLGEIKADREIKVFRNDKITVSQIKKMQPDRIIISPGPGRPKDAGISTEVIKDLGMTIPVLGVCLGHQCIGKVFGASIVQADKIFHGKTSDIYLENKNSLFNGVGNPFTATRYHSLIIEPESLTDELEVIATTEAGDIMAVCHRDYPITGVQFHPESILTDEGKKILKNFLN